MNRFSSSESYLFEGNGGVRQSTNKKALIIIGILAGAFGIGIGVLIGYFSRSIPEAEPQPEGPCLGPDVPNKIIQDGESDITDKIFRNVDAEKIRKLLQEFTVYPHLGGTEGEDQLAQELADHWREQGLDLVTERTYEVLLSYPDRDDPSQVYLMDGEKVLFESQKEEAILRPEQNHSDVIPPFNAYSPPADIKGQLVYANYGRREDFKFLEDSNIELNGTIVICRYGRIFRGDKVKFAQQNGAAGVLLYTDPKDYSINTTEGVYPDSWWLPPTGVQRGTVFADDGDPLTPGYPSIDTAYRLNETEANLPTIPALPISYGDAEELLKHMDGPDPPDESWEGDLDIPYKLGPGFFNDTWEIRLKITTHNKMVNTTNVFGYIYGSVEPDRYVLLGNHRDAWVFGAVDPTSGTAAMMEVSRVLAGLVHNDNWRPRRTIVFCSWGAEEYALVGSQEWVEEFRANLGERSVAYLNVDMAVQGNYSIRALGTPLLYTPLYEVAKKIETPNEPGKTIFDEWRESFPKPGDEDLPAIGSLGAGSDYASFLILTGITALDVRYTYNKNDWPILDYPLYHSVYETFHLVENFIDRDFQFHRAMTQFWAEMARYLADSLILPLDVESYAKALEENVLDLDEGYGDLMRNNSITLDGLQAAVEHFTAATVDFKARLDSVNIKNPAQTRMFNDQLMKLERAFLDAAGLPDRPLYKHLVFAPSSEDAYAGATFPGLVDLMFEIEADPDPVQRWERVKHHLSVIIFTIQSAASTLTDASSV